MLGTTAAEKSHQTRTMTRWRKIYIMHSAILVLILLLASCQTPPAVEDMIVFVSERDGDLEIYLMDIHGHEQTRLTDSPGVDNNPSCSPDGTKIAFHSFRNGKLEIYVMDANGSNQTRLTNNPAFDESPCWSPDGSKIAFNSLRDYNWEIYVMDADGSNQTRLTNNGACDMAPRWSPDGTKIAFDSDREGYQYVQRRKEYGNFEVYVMDADGSNQTRLTNNPAFDESPSWLPRLSTRP